MGLADYYGLPHDDPRRIAWMDGARAEAQAREVLDLVQAIVEHHKPATALELLLPVLRITSAGQDRGGRRAMRRAVRRFRG